jgi:hypothetical protein
MDHHFDWEDNQEANRGGHGSLPRINFPQFDGDNPQMWKSRCESYFDMYEVDRRKWIKIVSIHFGGRAVGLVAVDREPVGWSEFCLQIHERFGRGQHESLIRKLFHIRQLGSMADYVEQFSNLVDHLSAYEANADPLYCTMRFVDGLHDGINGAKAFDSRYCLLSHIGAGGSGVFK